MTKMNTLHEPSLLAGTDPMEAAPCVYCWLTALYCPLWITCHQEAKAELAKVRAYLQEEQQKSKLEATAVAVPPADKAPARESK